MSFCKGYFTGEVISDIDTRYNNDEVEISKFSSTGFVSLMAIFGEG